MKKNLHNRRIWKSVWKIEMEEGEYTYSQSMYQNMSQLLLPYISWRSVRFSASTSSKILSRISKKLPFIDFKETGKEGKHFLTLGLRAGKGGKGEGKTEKNVWREKKRKKKENNHPFYRISFLTGNCLEFSTPKLDVEIEPTPTDSKFNPMPVPQNYRLLKYFSKPSSKESKAPRWNSLQVWGLISLPLTTGVNNRFWRDKTRWESTAGGSSGGDGFFFGVVSVSSKKWFVKSPLQIRASQEQNVMEGKCVECLVICGGRDALIG